MEAVDALKSVLCGPDGKCCIAGSQADRDTVDTALAAIQHYLDQRKVELPVLPEHITDVLVITGPSTHKHMQAGQYYYTTSQAQAYGQQCAAQARELALSEAIAICRRNAQNTSADELEALKGK